MSGQIRSSFQIQNFLTKASLSCPVLSQDSKKCHLFYERQLEMTKMRVQKSDVITFARFLGNGIAKNKDAATKFCMIAVYMYLENKYSFLDNFKDFRFYRQLFSKKINFLSFGVQSKKSAI